jgi:hypothetical protein
MGKGPVVGDNRKFTGLCRRHLHGTRWLYKKNIHGWMLSLRWRAEVGRENPAVLRIEKMYFTAESLLRLTGKI